MQFSKEQMQQELLQFLVGFEQQVAELYGNSSVLKSECPLHHLPIIQVVDDMYDYGISGLCTSGLGQGDRFSKLYNKVEMFLRATDTAPMRLFLADRDLTSPRLAIRTAQTAAARIVLDGGVRYTDYALDELGVGNGDFGYLTLAEVALLANMDERSVRNAANPKLPDPLNTTQVGRRSLVTPDEARRWLIGRKAFVPTQKSKSILAEEVQSFDLVLPADVLAAMHREAQAEGIPLTKHLKDRLIAAYKEIQK